MVDTYKKRKVLLAFSGGIDSCYTAHLLLSQGYAVTALTMNMTGDEELLANASKKAYELGIPLIIEDVRQLFKEKVTGYFTSEYLSGRTPAPCTVCNYTVKWKVLYDKAVSLGIDHIATGHYFNISEHNGYFYAAKGADPVKDQSYYLWMLPQEILSKALMPMGSVIKNDIKDNKQAKESMGVCFLNGKPYKEYIIPIADSMSPIPASVLPGNVSDINGNIIGKHDGAAFYTTGQKKGLEIPSGFSVTGIDAAKNIIIAGTKEQLYRNTLIVTDCRLINPDDIHDNPNIMVKIRGIGKNPESGCRIKYDGRTMTIELDDPAWAPAAGQPVVLYDDDRVLGGGFLSESY